MDILEEYHLLKQENINLHKVLKMWVDFWEADGDDVWMAENAMFATEKLLKKGKSDERQISE